MPSSTTVLVPATTANIGPGFDCLGAALNRYNTLKFSPLENSPLENSPQNFEIVVRGAEAERVATDQQNLAYQAFTQLYHFLNLSPPAVRIEIELGVPLARGLGSSATAIIGGLMGANQLANQPLDTQQLMQLAIEIEGHPDNVVPALLGNCQLCVASEESIASSQSWQVCQIPWYEGLVPVIAIPTFELSTAEARRVLPSQYSKADAIFNAAHLGLLLRGLETGHPDWLRTAMADRIHQPYRQALISGYETVQQAALEAGAYGIVISGAGPTLLALTNPESAPQVALAMATAWNSVGIRTEVQVAQIDTQGARVS
ncbi:MAG: homoserine kinase [Microcoleaceae cyanobacterium]